MHMITSKPVTTKHHIAISDHNDIFSVELAHTKTKQTLSSWKFLSEARARQHANWVWELIVKHDGDIRATLREVDEYTRAHRYSDQQCQVDAKNQGAGTRRAAVAFLTIVGKDREADRAIIDSEAHIRTNVVGGTWAGHVESLCRVWNDGDHSTPYTEANARMIKAEKEGRDSWRPAIIPMSAAFAGLPQHS